MLALTEEEIEVLQMSAADPTQKSWSAAVASRTGWIDEDEFDALMEVEGPPFFELRQMLACFVLLANNIDPEI